MQKIILITALFLGSVATSIAQEKYTVTVEFSGMKSDTGKLYVALYDSEAQFLKKGIRREIVEVNDKKAIVTFKDVARGVYAVSSFHDVNNNQKMDTRIFGIPKEPVGISNNAKGFMGPPKFEDAKFEVTKNTTLQIQVN
ncbi:DUF2141 domain-containing protein [Tenacibaculum sp. TC6]|uniref:DUF2141 domain-containing protein n=1 Tax=Tenacibaculum sp. TC6 TaxID=3423223 RepID=UPI003D364D76